MPQAAVILLFILVAMLAANVILRANPGQLATIVQRTGGVLLIAAAIFVLLRGLFVLAIPLFMAGLMLLGYVPGLARKFSMGRRSAGQSSRVRTKILSMELDHDSGDLDGEVLAGTHAGKRLNSLNITELMEVRQECLVAADQSARLLDSYLDRVHEGWRQENGSQQEAPSSGDDTMSVADAYETLGLSPSASKSAIRRAHHDLMKKYHPDHGGSEYLARKINEARDLLLASS